MVVNEFVVVDASLAFKWLVEEEDSDDAESLLQSWERRGIAPIAPPFMPFEVVNALHRRVARAELTIESAVFLIGTRLIPLMQLHRSPEIHRRALELASELGQGAVYDSHYLALAEILDCEMWTADERFYRSASPVSARLHMLSEFVAPEL